MSVDPKALLGEPSNELDMLQLENEFVWDICQAQSIEIVQLKSDVNFLKREMKNVYGSLATENIDLNATIRRVVENNDKDYPR